MAANLQQRLHDKLINLGPTYHHSHELGETMLIVTRFSSDSQILLRDVVSFPADSRAGLITAVIFLVNNFSMMGNPPVWIQASLIATIFILPLGGWWLSLRLRHAYAKVRDSQMALANEFSNSAALPLEVQLMGAESQRSQVFGDRLAILFATPCRLSCATKLPSSFRSTPPCFCKRSFLFMGFFMP